METSGQGESVIEFTKTEQPLVSILIPTRSQDSLLEGCLKSLLTHISREVSYEVVIVLNAATEEVRKFVKQRTRGVMVLESAANLGVAGGYNRARSVARGEFILLLHDDTEISPGWLELLLETMVTHPAAGAVGSYQVFPDGRPQRAGSILWNNAVTSAVWGESPPTQEHLSGVRAVDYVGTCSTLVRTSAWDAIGGMDEEIFPAYFVDVDLCMKLRQAGFTVLCNPASQIRHYQGASTSRRFHVFIDGLNKIYFIGKWAAELATHEPFAPADPAAVARANERTARQAEDLAKRYTPRRVHAPPSIEVEKQEHAHFLREIELLRKYTKELETGESRVSERLDVAEANLETSRQMLVAANTKLEDSEAGKIRIKAALSKARSRVSAQQAKIAKWKERHQKLNRLLKRAKRSLWQKWLDRLRRR